MPTKQGRYRSMHFENEHAHEVIQPIMFRFQFPTLSCLVIRLRMKKK
jgi:hypothetical protein